MTQEVLHQQLSEQGGDSASKQYDSRGWLDQLRDDVAVRWTDLPVLACCAVSGLCDSVAFNATGTFASMQTGNTIFLALGAAFLPANQPLLWLRALVSIVAFWAGCIAFSKSRHFHPKRKATLSVSFLAQSAFIFAAAALAHTRTVPAFAGAQLDSTLSSDALEAHESDVNSAMSLLPLALLSFQFGGQIVMSRILGFSEVPTNVLTSLYCDLFSDPLLLSLPLSSNPKRNRRIAAMFLLVGGAVMGGWLQRSSAGMSSVLWIAGAIKLAIAIQWLIWPSRTIPACSDGEKATP